MRVFPLGWSKFYKPAFIKWTFLSTGNSMNRIYLYKQDILAFKNKTFLQQQQHSSGFKEIRVWHMNIVKELSVGACCVWVAQLLKEWAEGMWGSVCVPFHELCWELPSRSWGWLRAVLVSWHTLLCPPAWGFGVRNPRGHCSASTAKQSTELCSGWNGCFSPCCCIPT